MQGAGRPTKAIERLHELVRAVLRPAEDEGALDAGPSEQLVERPDLVDLADVDPGLVDRVDRRPFRADRDRRGVRRVALCDRADVRGEGRREEGRLARPAEEANDARDVGREAEVEEPVRLIEDEHADLREIERPARDEIDEATRRRHRDVSATTESELLVAVPDASIEGDDPYRAAAPEGLDFGGDLRAQLARGHDDEREGRGRAAVDALEDGQREGAGLPGAGLRLGKEVATRAQVRDRELLDGRERGPAERSCRPVEVRSKCDQGEGCPSVGLQKRQTASRGPSHISSGCPRVSVTQV